MSEQASREPGWDKGFRSRRIGYYLTGIAIGLFILGAVQLAKKGAQAKQQQQSSSQSK